MDDVKRKQVRQYAVAPVAMLAVIVWAGVFLSVAAAQDALDSSIEVKSKKKNKSPASGERERPVQPSQTEKTPSAGASGLDSYPVPDWVYDARWYYIDVPRFRNGDKSNDPDGIVPWSTLWPVCDDPASSKISSDTQAARGFLAREFGGDLRGVAERLGYLKELGVNAIILGGLFDKGSGARVNLQRYFQFRVHYPNATKKNIGPAPNPSELALSGLIKEAHRQGVRVALAYPYANDEHWAFPKVEDTRAAMKGLRRWFDFDGDGDRADATDAVWISNPADLIDYPNRGNIFRRKMAGVNPDCVVIGPCHGCVQWNTPPPFGFSFPTHNSKSGGSFRWMKRGADSNQRGPRINSCQPVSTTELMFSANHGARVRPDEGRRVRDRLAMILHHFGTGSPVTLYGDEVGIMRGTGEWGRPPMWWNDLPDPKTKSPDYRGDFFALVQWLHKMRAEHKPLRRGGFRLVLNDAANKIFSFARTLPGDEVILVMNYGDKKQKVMLPAGVPGQMVVAMTPMIDPSKSRLTKMTKGKYDHTKIAPLPVGGGRAFVNKEGKVRLWVAPMSIRVVLVNDKEPRR
jgi:cyclomaltodextrinase / maltogenic alpha-amylase / neopullulanase